MGKLFTDNPFISALLASGIAIGATVVFVFMAFPKITAADNSYATRKEMVELRQEIKQEMFRRFDILDGKVDHLTIAVGRLQGAQGK